MTTPLPPKPPSKPPIHPQKRVGTSGRHGASGTTIPQFSSGQASSKNTPPQKSMAERSVSPNSPIETTGKVELFGQDPSGQMKTLHKQLTTQITDFWLRDQITIMHKIMTDPGLAAKMGISIKVQLPGTSSPVQVYPVIEGASKQEEHAQCQEFLQQSAIGLNAKTQEKKPANELFEEYVNTRNRFIELGEALYPDFSWHQVYDRILRSAINEAIETDDSEFLFIREQPDSTKTLSQEVLDELSRYNLERLEEEKKEEALLQKKINQPEGKSTLKNPKVEFRVTISESEIERHRANMENQEPLASGGSHTADT